MKEIGRIRGMAMNQGVEGYSLALYTRYLGWSADELRVLLAKVRSEFNDLNNRMYIAVYVVLQRMYHCASLICPQTCCLWAETAR